MLTLINILIVFFVLLIAYQIFLAYYKNTIQEGLTTVNNTTTNDINLTNEYKDYDMNDQKNALILAQQNAGNISYIKERLDNVQNMYNQFQDLSGNVGALQTQVNGLVTAQQQYATQMTGGTAPNITGATTSDTSSVDTSNLVT
jgi:hypothetical protein